MRPLSKTAPNLDGLTFTSTVKESSSVSLIDPHYERHNMIVEPKYAQSHVH